MQAEVEAELDKVVRALGDFYTRETHLLDKDLGERALTHRLAVHLENRFHNRLGERRLRLPKALIVSTDDDSGKSVFPDIIVHRRTVPENLLAIELRKATNHQPGEHDRHKLRAMTDPHLWHAFRAGVLLILAKKNVAVPEVYVGGVVDAGLSGWLSQRLAEGRLLAG
jgi:hypothetical protein